MLVAVALCPVAMFAPAPLEKMEVVGSAFAGRPAFIDVERTSRSLDSYPAPDDFDIDETASVLWGSMPSAPGDPPEFMHGSFTAELFCTLTGGEEVMVGWHGMDTAENSCNTCTCQEAGTLVCTMMACENTEQTQAVVVQSSRVCTLSGGEEVPSGWSGDDTGANWCNTCSCDAEGHLLCTQAFCFANDKTTCTLNNGVEVKVGWVGFDTGSNSCNTCSCQADGLLLCTLMACAAAEQRTEASTCTLTGGDVVEEGWNGYDTGGNSCNKCTCRSGALGCTEMDCGVVEDLPQPAAQVSLSTCTLTGGDVVEDGWAGKDTGANSCNNCMCSDGLLGCTKMNCDVSEEPPLPTTQDLATTCTLSGGDVVEDGWAGKDTGANSCNNCMCSDGLLGCTKKIC